VASNGTIISGSWDYTVRIWKGGTNFKTFKDHTLAIWDVTVMPGDRLFVSASADKHIKLFSSDSWRMVRTLTGQLINTILLIRSVGRYLAHFESWTLGLWM
jgi:WD40 repeat protein